MEPSLSFTKTTTLLFKTLVKRSSRKQAFLKVRLACQA
jgi:hypothetical protein